MSSSTRWDACWAALLVGVALFSEGCQPPPPAAAASKPPEVFVANPTVETVTDYEEYSGRLGAENTVEIRARVSGYLQSVDFKDGADLLTGAPLFHIDPRPFAAALAQAEGNVAQFDARLERWKRQESRLDRLVPQKVTTEQDVEVVKFQRLETEAELQSARAALDNAKLNLDFTTITSPLNGRISRRLVDPGNLIKADDTLLATIVSLDPIYAYFDVDERTVLQVRRLIAEGRIKSARDSKISIDLALADENAFTLQGTIDFIDNQLSPTTGTLRIRAAVENPQKLLAPGMFIRVQVPIGAPREALLVREEALGSDQGQKFVYVLNEKDEVIYRKISPGRLVQGRRVVNQGLNSDDRVIVSGLQRVRPGVVVTPKPAEEPANTGVAQTKDLGTQ